MSTIPKMFILVALLAMSDFAAGASSHGAIMAMEKVFARSETAHMQSMSKIMSGMTSNKAWQVLEKHNLTTPALIQIKSRIHGKQSSLRKTSPQGYSGVEGARKMLNDMIYDSMMKYDAAISECKGAYAHQCAAMEALRSQIHASNYMASEAAAVKSEQESRIDRMNIDIPATKERLGDHEHTCAQEFKTMEARKHIIEGDEEVLSSILNMTQCAATSLMQTEPLKLMQCEDPCTKKSFITFNYDKVQKKLNQLRSPASQQLVQDTFQHVLVGDKPLKSVSLLKLHSNLETEPSDGAAPRTEVPANPCDDEFAGAPSMNDKNANKCTLSGANCEKLRERFLNIQAGIEEEKDDLVEEMAKLKEYCEDVKKTLKLQILTDSNMLSDSKTHLVEAISNMQTSGETADNTAKYHEELKLEMKAKMESCSQDYINFESELCALKKIRGELYQMQGSGHSAFFQDCEVGEWQEKPCTETCGGGEQDLERAIESPANGGAKCLPLTEKRRCNLEACAVDCEVEEWDGWSKCTAECGGGVKQRVRNVRVQGQHGGKECDLNSETQECNSHGCDKDCVLGGWTPWSMCSKDCGGGTNKRVKYVVAPPEGQGKCAGEWSPERLQYKECHTHKCPKLTCNKELDVVLLLDGSGSLGQKGWDAEITAANNLVERFHVEGTKAKVSVVLYSGPSYRWRVKWCLRGWIKADYIGSFCKLKSVISMQDAKSEDMTAVKNELTALHGPEGWPKGSTLTSMALYRARDELNLGREDAKSVVIVFTDGKPYNFKKTLKASKAVRESARLVYVPVIEYAPLKLFKWMATRRWQENIVPVKDFNDLESAHVANDIIADICPSSQWEA